MIPIWFYLKRPNAKTEQVVYAQLRINGKRLKIYTDVKLLPEQWSLRQQRVKRSVAEAGSMNQVLDDIRHEIIETVADLKNRNRPVTIHSVRDAYSKRTAATKKGSQTFLEYFEEWIEESKHQRTEGTIQVYDATLNHLRSYAKEYGVTLDFEGMNKQFLTSFATYLGSDCKLQNSTLWKILKTWKTFLRWAAERELTENRFYDKVKKQDYDNVATEPVRLTEEELRVIADYDLSEHPALYNVRQQFVLQCLTGVRYGDLQKIVGNIEAYYDGKSIRLTTEKNRRPVLVPLLDRAKAICKSASELHPVSNQKFNDMIKEVARLAGLERRIVITEFRGSKRIDEIVELHEIVSSHVAKRTFVSIMATKNISTEALKRFTGNTDKTIGRYLHLFEPDLHREMLKAEGVV